jgi:hypothetical protein
MGTPDCDKTRSTSNDNEAPISHRSKRPRITLATTRDVGVFPHASSQSAKLGGRLQKNDG